MIYGSADSYKLQEKRCRDFIPTLMARGIRYGIAPGRSYKAASGLTYTEGEEVTAALLNGSRDENGDLIAGWKVLERLQRELTVVDSGYHPTGPEAA